MGGTAKIIPVLRLVQPTCLTGLFARFTAHGARTISRTGSMGRGNKHLLAMQTDGVTGLVHGLTLSKPPSMNKIKPPKKKNNQTVRAKNHGRKKKIRKDFYEWMERISNGSTSTFKPPLSSSFIPALANAGVFIPIGTELFADCCFCG